MNEMSFIHLIPPAVRLDYCNMSFGSYYIINASSSFLVNTSTAQQWGPHLLPHIIFAPQYQPALPPPPPPPLHEVLVFELPYHHALPPVCHNPTLMYSPPCYKAAQPIASGEAEVSSPVVECPPVGRKWLPPARMRRVIRSFNFDKKPARKLVWRPKNANGAAASPPCDEDFPPSSETTVMIRNIPNQIRRDFMVEFVDGYCREYSLEYDFLYLPMDFRKEDNLGYGFVNFTTSGGAQKFKNVLQNYEWGSVRGSFISNKICETTWATIQGKEELVKRFQDSKFECDKPDFLPERV